MPNNSFLVCRVCGKIQDDPPWGDDGQYPSHNICDCCGVEFGYGDCNLKAIISSRRRWLKGGAIWRYPEEKPVNWSQEEQLKQIPDEYKEDNYSKTEE
jgi:hypothetical protein